MRVTTSPFILQMIDPHTGCAIAEARLHIHDLGALRRILGVDAGDAHALEYEHEVGPDTLGALGALSQPPFIPDPIFTRLSPWCSLRDVPYLVHTNFELPLMLEGRKPFAKFSDVYPVPWFEAQLARFDPYVQQRRFVRRIIDEPFENPITSLGTELRGIRRAYFSLPDEAWRIDAHLLLEAVAAKSGWNASLTRFEGSLLGYEDWQNDWWIEHRFKPMNERSSRVQSDEVETGPSLKCTAGQEPRAVSSR